VQRHLMLAGYWWSPPELRRRLDRWKELDEADATVAEGQLDLMATVMAR
jgi:hypothetical protein